MEAIDTIVMRLGIPIVAVDILIYNGCVRNLLSLQLQILSIIIFFLSSCVDVNYLT